MLLLSTFYTLSQVIYSRTRLLRGKPELEPRHAVLEHILLTTALLPTDPEEAALGKQLYLLIALG